MTSIDQLLSRALLLKHPRVPADVAPYDDAAYPDVDFDDGPAWHEAADPDPDPVGDTAALDLQTLCETVVTRTAVTSLSDFVTEQLPAPRGARVLGCILQLADAEDGARFWWQYAAGAGDDAASYCLYLHHLSNGESYAAAWWRKQTSIDTQPAPETVVLPGVPEPADTLSIDASTPTVLRVLNRLVEPGDRCRIEVIAAVMDYVPGAVAAGYADNPDVEIPSLGPNFAEHIGVILAATTCIPGAEPFPRHVKNTDSRADMVRRNRRCDHDR